MTTARLTDAELQAIEAEADGDCSNCFALLAEARALMAERDGLRTELTHETDRHGATIKQRNELELLLEESRRVERAALKMAESLDSERIAARADAARLRERLEAVLRRFYVGHTSTADGCNECDEAAKIRAALAATSSAEWLAERDAKVRAAALEGVLQRVEAAFMRHRGNSTSMLTAEISEALRVR